MSLYSASIKINSNPPSYSAINFQPLAYDFNGYNIYENKGFDSLLLTNKENLDNLSRFLNESTLFDSIKLMFQNVTECITSLMWFPFPIIGWRELNDDAQKKYYLKINGVSSANLSSDKQTKVFPIPTLRPVKIINMYIRRKFNNFLDYAPYTKLSIRLPFYGEVELNINDFLEKYLVALLMVDLKSGMGKYVILRSDDDFYNYSDQNITSQVIITQLECKIGIEIPLTKTNFSECIRNMWLGLGTTASLIASSGLVGTSTRVTTSSTTRKDLVYRKPTARSRKVAKNPYLEGLHTKDTTSISTTKSSNHHLGSLATYSSFNALQNMYTRVQSDKNIGNYTNMIDNNKFARVLLRYPKVLDTNISQYLGHPLGKVKKIKDLNSGFFKCTAIHLTGTTATNEEIIEIEELLSSGVIKD